MRSSKEVRDLWPVDLLPSAKEDLIGSSIASEMSAGAGLFSPRTTYVYCLMCMYLYMYLDMCMYM